MPLYPPENTPAGSLHNKEVALTAAEKAELLNWLRGVFPEIPAKAEVTRFRYAEDGASAIHNLVVELSDGEMYGIRVSSNANQAPLATEVLEACRVPTYSPLRRAPATPIIPHFGQPVLYRRLKGARNLNHTTIDPADRVEALRDAGAWTCMGPVIGVADMHGGNYVWDAKGKRFARVDLQDAFQGDFSLQTMLWPFTEKFKLLNRAAWKKAHTPPEQGGAPDAGVEAFKAAFAEVAANQAATKESWLPKVKAAHPHRAAQIEEWIAKPLEEKFAYVEASLP